MLLSASFWCSFSENDFVGNISQVFSKTVVYKMGGFADVKRLAFGADDAVNHTGRNGW